MTSLNGGRGPAVEEKGSVSLMHSQLVQLASERRREMLAEAKQQRPMWLQLAYRRASRHAERAERRMYRACRTVARLRAEL
jgi:hypothetical protein